MVKRRLRISGVYNYAPEDLASVLAFLKEPGARRALDGMLRASFRLDQIEEAFHYAMEQRPLRVAIYPQREKPQ